MRLVAITAVVLAGLAATASRAQAIVVADAGALKAEIITTWNLKLINEHGGLVLQEDPSRGDGPAGTIGFSTGGSWRHATRILSQDFVSGGSYRAELETNDPAGRTIEVQLNPAADGVIRFDATVRGAGPPLDAVGIGFRAQPNERYLGFGERSQAVDQRGNVVENYVADGPYQRSEWPLIEGIVPPWGFRPREDATYYPLPWLLSTAGYGVLVDTPATTYFRLDQGGSWSVEVTKAPPDEMAPATAPDVNSISMRFFAGPKPADVLSRFTAVEGRQPPPPAPWVFGPWIQPNGGTDEQLALLDQLQQADAPMSVAQTYLHYLPCGDQRGRRAQEQARTAAVHQRGLAITTYINPMVCTDYQPVFDRAAASGGLIENTLGDPYLFQYSTNTSFQVAEFDFTSPGGRDAFASVIDEAIGDGHDGWMEDFGEYTPLDSRTSGGIPGTVEHNRYATDYHCAASNAAAAAGRPIVRFQRSGYLGAAPCATVVWGGDPTTAWDFDGLRSAVRQALTMGLSGISTWGSDIGGFFALFQNELTPELLTRWVQFGAVSGVMRTEADGIAVPDKSRPQVWDADQIDNWRRYAKLHTQLYPYLVAADGEYQRTGLPLMRQLSLVYPDDATAAGRDDEFMFGPDLLAAPVVEPTATERSLYLPQGRWVDMWRTLRYRESDGALRMQRAKVVRGPGDVTLPAPLDELPLLARAGAVLPLAARGRRHPHRLPQRLDDLARRARGAPVAARVPACQEQRPDVRRRADQVARARQGLGAEGQG